MYVSDERGGGWIRVKDIYFLNILLGREKSMHPGGVRVGDCNKLSLAVAVIGLVQR